MPEYTATRIDGRYTVEFSPPIYSLPAAVGSMLANVHRRLCPRVDIPMSALQGMPGTNFESIGARVDLYGGAMRIEITPGRFFVQVERLQTEEDIQKISDCVELAFRVVLDHIADAKEESVPVRSSLRASFWLDQETGEYEDGALTLNKLTPALISEWFGKELRAYHPKFVLRDSETGVDTDVELQPSALPDGGIYCTLNLASGISAMPLSFSALVERTRFMLGKVLNSAGVSLKEDTDA